MATASRLGIWVPSLLTYAARELEPYSELGKLGLLSGRKGRDA